MALDPELETAPGVAWYRAVLPDPTGLRRVLALRVELPRGVRDGAAFPLPLRFSCGHGTIEEVEWQTQSLTRHAGGDPLILEDLFLRSAPDRPYEILAGAKAGALAVAVGEAVFRSCREGRPIKIAELLT